MKPLVPDPWPLIPEAFREMTSCQVPEQVAHVMVSVMAGPSTITTVLPVLVWSGTMKYLRNKLHVADRHAKYTRIGADGMWEKSHFVKNNALK